MSLFATNDWGSTINSEPIGTNDDQNTSGYSNNSNSTSTPKPQSDDYAGWSWEEILNTVLGMSMPGRSTVTALNWVHLDYNDNGDPNLHMIWGASWLSDTGFLYHLFGDGFAERKATQAYLDPTVLESGSPWDVFLNTPYQTLGPAVTARNYSQLPLDPNSFFTAGMAQLEVEVGLDNWRGALSGMADQLNGDLSGFKGDAGGAFATLVGNLVTAVNDAHQKMTQPVSYGIQLGNAGSAAALFLDNLVRVYGAWAENDLSSPLGALVSVLMAIATPSGDGRFTIPNPQHTIYGDLTSEAAWPAVQQAAKNLWTQAVASMLDGPAQQALQTLVLSYENTAKDLAPVTAPALAPIVPSNANTSDNGLSNTLNNGFGNIENNFNGINKGFGSIDTGFNNIGHGFNNIGQNFNNVGQNFNNVGGDFTGVQNGFKSLGGNLNSIDGHGGLNNVGISPNVLNGVANGTIPGSLLNGAVSPNVLNGVANGTIPRNVLNGVLNGAIPQSVLGGAAPGGLLNGVANGTIPESALNSVLNGAVPASVLSGVANGTVPRNVLNGVLNGELPENILNGVLNGELPENILNGVANGTIPESALNSVLNGAVPASVLSGVANGTVPRNVLNGVLNGELPENVLNGVANGTIPESALNSVLNGEVPRNVLNGVLNGKLPESVLNGVANGTVPHNVLNGVLNGKLPESVLNGVANGTVPHNVLNGVLNGKLPESVLNGVANGTVPHNVLNGVLNGKLPESVLNGVANGTVPHNVLSNGGVPGPPQLPRNFDVKSPSLLGPEHLLKQLNKGSIFSSGTAGGSLQTPGSGTQGSGTNGLAGAPGTAGASTVSTGRFVSPSTPAGDVQPESANGTGAVPFYPPSMGAMGGMGGQQGQSGQERERTTWLAEDEDTWGTEPDAVPTVIGRLDPDEEDADIFDEETTRKSDRGTRRPSRIYGR